MANKIYMDMAEQVGRRLGERFDASESVFFARELEWVRAQAFEVQYEELKGRSLVSINREASPADELFTYQIFDHVGQAKIAAGYETPGPRVDIFGSEVSQRFHGIIDAYGWSFQDLRASIRARKRLPMRKAKAAREAIERKIDTLILTGDTDLTLTGLFNQTATGVDIANVALGVAASRTWALKTADEILLDLNEIASFSHINSKEVESASRLLMPLASLDQISTRRLGDGSDTTILKHFLANSPFIKEVRAHSQLDTAGVTNTRRMVAYDPRPDRMEMPISQEFEQFAPQFVGYEILTNCHARASALALYRPLSLVYRDGM